MQITVFSASYHIKNIFLLPQLVRLACGWDARQMSAQRHHRFEKTSLGASASSNDLFPRACVCSGLVLCFYSELALCFTCLSYLIGSYFFIMSPDASYPLFSVFSIVLVLVGLASANVDAIVSYSTQYCAGGKYGFSYLLADIYMNT